MPSEESEETRSTSNDPETGRGSSRYRIHRDNVGGDLVIRSGPGERRDSTASRRSSNAGARAIVGIPTSGLTGYSKQFSRIARGDFASCKRFLEDHPSILDDNPTDYLTDGRSALVSGSNAVAESCVQQASLLEKIKGKSARDRGRFLDELIRRPSASLEEFTNGFENAMQVLRHRTEAIEAARLQNVSTTTSRGSGRGSVLQDRHNNNRGAGNVTRHQARNPLGTVLEQGSGQPATGRNTRSNAPTHYGPAGEIERIDERYHVPDSSFFVCGRVLATLWHTSVGASHDANRPGWINQGRFGEQVLSHIQRMVVVKEDRGFCWCIPINTYNGRGVAKFADNRRREIHAHAIIYMSNAEASTPDWESSMIKDPIEVRPAGLDQKLDQMSRINFGKVHTLEHNTKVMNVGRVTNGSMPYFQGYWRAKVNEEPQRSSEQTRR